MSDGRLGIALWLSWITWMWGDIRSTKSASTSKLLLTSFLTFPTSTLHCAASICVDRMESTARMHCAVTISSRWIAT